MNAFVTAGFGLAFFGLTAAAQERAPEFPVEQIKQGADLFARNCATCHGARMRNPQMGSRPAYFSARRTRAFRRCRGQRETQHACVG